MRTGLRLHGSCVARMGAGVLILGPSGSGKSDLALRLVNRNFTLVADDQVEITGTRARAPAALAGLLEVRGLGIVRLPFLSGTDLKIIIALNDQYDRLPSPERHATLALPVVRLRAFEVSSPDKVVLALDCALGHVTQVSGAFAS